MAVSHPGVVEFVLGGLASCGAGFFTNPLEVVKTRMQLQGELKALGQYSIHYRNVFHAFVAIAKNDGILALQNGLVPALWYQFFMNGTRLGTFQIQVNLGFTKDKNGNHSFVRSLIAGAVSGCSGAVVGSPLYLTIYKEHGVTGLWRGVSGATSRVTVGSAAQLSTFSSSKNFIEGTEIFRPNSWITTLAASMISGVAVTFFMTPFDVVSTRLYNQPVNQGRSGVLYSGLLNCFLKIYRTEGLMGFYKGWAASYIRLGPHTTIGLMLWDQFRQFYEIWKNQNQSHVDS